MNLFQQKLFQSFLVLVFILNGIYINNFSKVCFCVNLVKTRIKEAFIRVLRLQSLLNEPFLNQLWKRVVSGSKSIFSLRFDKFMQVSHPRDLFFFSTYNYYKSLLQSLASSALSTTILIFFCCCSKRNLIAVSKIYDKIKNLMKR